MKKLILWSALLLAFTQISAQSMDQTIYQFTMESITGEEVSLQDYEGKVVLLVNVASKCGLTPQYADLEELYRKHKDQGLVILGFPANNFGGQEPGTNEEIMTFCSTNFDVSFPMFSKISVKGDDQHPLYKFLTSKDQNGVHEGQVSWNFQKFLVGKDGKLVESIPPQQQVSDPKIENKIAALLN